MRWAILWKASLYNSFLRLKSNTVVTDLYQGSYILYLIFLPSVAFAAVTPTGKTVRMATSAVTQNVALKRVSSSDVRVGPSILCVV